MFSYLAKVQFAPWDKLYNFDVTEFAESLKKGDYVIVTTKLGKDIGTIKEISRVPSGEIKEEIVSIDRIADDSDVKFINDLEKGKDDIFTFCKEQINELNLDMKLIDVHFSFDGSRLTFAFIANGRVDFRELVRTLTRHYQKSIRLQQVGVRDETKAYSDQGVCGRRTCCGSFLKDLGNVSSEAADVQQVSHRGADRLSGICGRLKCCLRYEQELYETLSHAMPPLESQVKILKSGNTGKVIQWHTLKQSVTVLVKGKDEGIFEVPIKELKVVRK